MLLCVNNGPKYGTHTWMDGWMERQRQRHPGHMVSTTAGLVSPRTLSKPSGTPASTKVNSKSLCTNFSCTQKGTLCFAEIVLCLGILIHFSALAQQRGHSSLLVMEWSLLLPSFVIYMCDLHTKMQFIS